MIASQVLATFAMLVASVIGTPFHQIARDDAVTTLDKPTVQPPAVNLDEYLQLPSFPYEVTPWDNGKINYACKKIFTTEDYKLEDIEMFHVTYDDCYMPWVMCRHKDAQHTMNSTAHAIASIPVGMRQYLRHVVVLPKDDPELGPDFYNDFDSIILKGNTSLHNIIAAIAKSLGTYGAQQGNGYWNTQSWLDAYHKDTAVLNPTCQINEEENFAQMTVVAIADYQRPGTWEPYRIPEFHKIRNQVQHIRQDLGKHFEVGTGNRCTRRPLEDSPVELPGELPPVE
ncbi:hypothetical protein P153DRAFT_390702 [Dothidotthia symphoricarpi CBS 119687]|uniref:Uncharacterized protein n=1 Tax=Dothidotthia symphoricarpi CBS 119687 TaxID=1392245 RepID=A0A6A5ZYR1_9PLEO|nr:uncharacterized protein P153DRAFT_390702 [Dothidotthia symphoricarpi CBS 119687]KAF2124155.1 hypothetical protein P153DRAFT_390702 [Dothidotthia symphoricarpi CBS 119687]